MKIVASSPKLLFNSHASLHGYAAWPTVARLKDGRLAAAFSGLRMAHVCPFGKSLVMYSEDEGKTWSAPQIAIDTMLDDRDSGICPFGTSSVVVTSFNNTPAVQREWNEAHRKYLKDVKLPEGVSREAYCDCVEGYVKMVEKSPRHLQYLGSTFVISHDNGKSFGDIHNIPVTSPHGPLEMPDGTLYYVGSVYESDDKSDNESKSEIAAYRIYPDGRYERVCTVAKGDADRYFCEPHALRLDDGKIIVHIRVQQPSGGKKPYFTVFQCESTDGGFSYSAPQPLLSDQGGAPAHLLRLSDGTLLSVYSYRSIPFGIRAMFSRDGGKTWDTDNVVVKYDNEDDSMGDIGYPSTVQLHDGSLFTVYYAHATPDDPAEIFGVNWRIEN